MPFSYVHQTLLLCSRQENMKAQMGQLSMKLINLQELSGLHSLVFLNTMCLHRSLHWNWKLTTQEYKSWETVLSVEIIISPVMTVFIISACTLRKCQGKTLKELSRSGSFLEWERRKGIRTEKRSYKNEQNIRETLIRLEHLPLLFSQLIIRSHWYKLTRQE